MNRIEIRKIGITDVGTDAIVNAANEGLWAGGGVCGAIFAAAGMNALSQECKAIGHCDTGSAVITPGFKLSKYIIHAVGPRWGMDHVNEKKKLYSAYQAALKLAVENGCTSVGFPLISAGIFGVPVEVAWRKALQACTDFKGDIRIVFAVLDNDILAIGRKMLSEMNENGNDEAAISDKKQMIIFHDVDKEYGFLSNWYPSEFELADQKFTSVEQYLMYRKAELFGDAEMQKKIMATGDPAIIQKYGRLVKSFNSIVWDGFKQLILHEALDAKFRCNTELGDLLLATGDAILVEGTASDKVFANGLLRDDPDRFDMSKWKGKNLLGFTLMEVRMWERSWREQHASQSGVF